MAQSIRDLLSGAPHPDEVFSTFQTALGPSIEVGITPDPLDGFFARMPGDSTEGHIKAAEVIPHPVPGMSASDLSRQLREGAFPIDLERKVRAYIAQYQRFTGEVLYDPRNHIPICPVEQQTADRDTVSPIESGSLRSADPFNLGDFQWGQQR